MSSTDAPEVFIRPEPTPNPNSVRFVVDRPLLPGGTAEFPGADQAENSPLARRLFAIDEVDRVLIGPDFVSITSEAVDWATLGERVMETIREHVASGEEAVAGGADAVAIEAKTETERGIMRVIDQEIRPAVAMDGGDIIYGGFENGVVHLHLRGSCHGCPSSMMTLKMGIERRLQEEFPEVQAVEAI